jgi:hypothetical protein
LVRGFGVPDAHFRWTEGFLRAEHLAGLARCASQLRFSWQASLLAGLCRGSPGMLWAMFRPAGAARRCAVFGTGRIGWLAGGAGTEGEDDAVRANRELADSGLVMACA